MERVDVRGLVMNRTKALVLALFAVYWIIIVTISSLSRFWQWRAISMTVNCLKQ
jgi:hypothetical protein